jgi:hypothetical protein
VDRNLHAGRSWGKKDETPGNHRRTHGMSLISTITSRGQMRFMIKEKGGVNAAVFRTLWRRRRRRSRERLRLAMHHQP